jgi:hypothetical protein
VPEVVSSTHDDRRRAARRRLVIAAVAAGVLAATALVASLGIGSHPGSTRTAPQPAPARQGSPGVQPTPGHPAGAPVPLPAPGHVVDGVPTGYPDTAPGAVSCAAHYFEALDLFDPGAAQQQARVIAQPGFGDVFALQAKTAAEAVRTAAGLSADGTSDNANYAARQARDYQIANASPARIELFLLMDDTTSAKGVVSTSTQVQAAAMVWSAGDWHMAVGQRLSVPTPRSVVPDSPEAEREGWQTIAYEK